MTKLTLLKQTLYTNKLIVELHNLTLLNEQAKRLVSSYLGIREMFVYMCVSV